MPSGQNSDPNIRQGIYNVDYFSGAQMAVYIGDVWVDEITSISYAVQQSRSPLYGYADQLFKDVSKGQVLIQGEFAVNFKEAGYLFLVLDRFQTLINNRPSVLNVHHKAFGPGTTKGTPFSGNRGEFLQGETIESLINNDNQLNTFERNKVFEAIAASDERTTAGDERGRQSASTSLGGFSSTTRSTGGIGLAENIFEAFEDAIWKRPEKLEELTRRIDDPRLSPFDVFMAFGDFAGDNSANHTIQKLTDVHIIGQARQVIIDGQPIQEAYSFIARNLV